MRIGEIAEATKVSVQTIRYYERCGFLSATRSPSGYRAYAPFDVQIVRFVKHAQSFGFTLKEIRQLLSLRETHGRCSVVKAMIAAKLAEIDLQIARDAKNRTLLKALDIQCSATAMAEHCPLFSLLDGDQGGKDGRKKR